MMKRKEVQSEINPTEENKIDLMKEEIKLKRFQKIEEEYWNQKARIQWFRYGDKNTKFFHAYAKGRRNKLMIQKTENEKAETSKNNQDIGDEAVRVFQD